jgi:hypothetical protein
VRADSTKHIAKGKGVHREVESEGSRRQSSDPRNTNSIRRSKWGKTAIQVKAQKLHGHESVNVAGTHGMKVNRLTVGGLTDGWKQSKKPG